MPCHLDLRAPHLLASSAGVSAAPAMWHLHTTATPRASPNHQRPPTHPRHPSPPHLRTSRVSGACSVRVPTAVPLPCAGAGFEARLGPYDVGPILEPPPQDDLSKYISLPDSSRQTDGGSSPLCIEGRCRSGFWSCGPLKPVPSRHQRPVLEAIRRRATTRETYLPIVDNYASHRQLPIPDTVAYPSQLPTLHNYTSLAVTHPLQLPIPYSSREEHFRASRST